MEDGHRRAGYKLQMEDGHTGRRAGCKDRWRMGIGGQVARTDGGWT